MQLDKHLTLFDQIVVYLVKCWEEKGLVNAVLCHFVLAIPYFTTWLLFGLEGSLIGIDHE